MKLRRLYLPSVTSENTLFSALKSNNKHTFYAPGSLCNGPAQTLFICTTIQQKDLHTSAAGLCTIFFSPLTRKYAMRRFCTEAVSRICFHRKLPFIRKQVS